MLAPREIAERLEQRAELPRGEEGRFSGYAVMAVPFASGHVPGLRHFPVLERLAQASPAPPTRTPTGRRDGGGAFWRRSRQRRGPGPGERSHRRGSPPRAGNAAAATPARAASSSLGVVGGYPTGVGDGMMRGAEGTSAEEGLTGREAGEPPRGPAPRAME
jgi:hypothetical protein